MVDAKPTVAATGSFLGVPFACASPSEALALCVAATRGVTEHSEVCSLAESIGRVLASDATLPRDSPPFDHSAMDGYAIADITPSPTAPVRLEIVGESLLGREPPRLTDSGRAIRVSTGAPIPPGTDRVIRREDVEEHASSDGSITAISIAAAALLRSRSGDHVRGRGENARAGATAVSAGTVLQAVHIGALAACGIGQVSLRKRLRVQIITTGDELARPGAPVGPYGIFDSNGPALHALASQHRWIELSEPVQVRDVPGLVTARVREAAESHDAVLLTGGVSMGHRDPVRAAISNIGARILFHGLPQRPGKPMLAAVAENIPGRPVLLFGLPGNPVSALVTATRIALPALAARAGATSSPAGLRVKLRNDDGKRIAMWWHRLVNFAANGEAELVDHRGSGDLVAAAMSSGFIEIPPEGDHTSAAPSGTALYFPFTSTW